MKLNHLGHVLYGIYGESWGLVNVIDLCLTFCIVNSCSVPMRNVEDVGCTQKNCRKFSIRKSIMASEKAFFVSGTSKYQKNENEN